MTFNKSTALTFALSGLFLIGCSDGFMRTNSDKIETEKSVRAQSGDVSADGKLTNDLTAPLIGAWYSACLQDINVDEKSAAFNDSKYFKREILIFEASSKVIFERTTYLDSSCVVERRSEDGSSLSISDILNFSVEKIEDNMKLTLWTGDDVAAASEQTFQISKGKLTLTSSVDENSTTSNDLLVNEYYSSINVAGFLKRQVSHKPEENKAASDAKEDTAASDEKPEEAPKARNEVNSDANRYQP